MVVFHHHDHSTNISGTVVGSNIATGSSQINDSPITYKTGSQLAAALRGLSSLAAGLSRTNQATVAQALDSLAAAAESGTTDFEDIEENVRTVSEISPSISEGLKQMAAGAGSSLTASGIIEGIKVVFGVS